MKNLNTVKMIVTDLDGTLLRDDKTISEQTISTLKKCRDKGIKVVYATARGKSAEKYVPSEIFDGRIIMNGATTYEADKIVRSRLVDIDIARDFLVACDKRGLKVAAELNGMHYSNFNVQEQWDYINYYEIVDFNTFEKDAEKLYAVVNDESDIAFIKEHLPQDSLYLIVSRDGLAMVMDIFATKAHAINALAEHWGIRHWSKRTVETIAFGDDLNDVDMLIHASVGVAMGNALDEVKKYAKFICDTNNNDGVAKWLEENVP